MNPASLSEFSAQNRTRTPPVNLGLGNSEGLVQQQAQPVSERAGEIPSQMRLIETALDQLGAEIELLERSLSPVMTSHVSGESSLQGQQPFACEHGETLNRYAYAARRMAIKVAELRTRLEV